MPAKKSASSSSKSSKTRQSSGREAYIKQRNQHRQRSALITFCVAILLFILLIIGEAHSGVFGQFIKNLLTGLFGICKFILPFVLGYSAVLISKHTDTTVSRKIIGASVLVALLCSFIHLVVAEEGLTFFEIFSFDNLSYWYKEGAGGIIGAVFGGIFMVCFGRIISIIALILLAVIFVLIINSVTLADIVQFIGNKFKSAKENKSAVVPQEPVAKPVIKKPRFNPDVKIDDTPDKPTEQDAMDEAIAALAPPPAPEEAPQPLEEPQESLNDVIARVQRENEIKREKAAAAFAAKQQEEELEEAANKPAPVYNLPSVDLLLPSEDNFSSSKENLKGNAERLVDTLRSFGVETRVLNVSVGPAVTRYELQPAAGVKISRITSLADDIALNLAASGVRIEAPIPNKRAVGIEVPNRNVNIVRLREVIESNTFNEANSPLTVSLGRDISGNVVTANLAKMPHLLIAGATGAGKSVCINSFIISLLYKSTPEQVKLIMIDPKMVELGIYNGIPHLYIPVVTDPRKAAGALNWAVREMEKRYATFAEHNVRDLSGYNDYAAKSELEPMPQIVIIIDELADLMMTAPKDVEESITRLAQKARAAGMHLVVATQRPSVDVITGIIKANIPSRLAFAVSSNTDSRTILDAGGAEKLLGRGDMLFHPLGQSKPMRIQGCFVTDAEVEKVIEFVKQSGAVQYDDTILDEIDKLAAKEKGEKSAASDDASVSDGDEKLKEAITLVVEEGQASTSRLQTKLRLGYARAARIMEEMEERGIIGPAKGSKPRDVLITRQQWIEMNVASDDVITDSDNADFEEE